MKLLEIVGCIFLAIFSSDCVNFNEDLIVVTKQGAVKGLKATNDDYHMFLGIPYAKVDPQNAFGESLPYPHFEDTFEANDDRSECPQKGMRSGVISGDLDCLRLNVYVPNTSDTEQKNLPVMVFVHGGRFDFGSGGSFGGSYLVKHDVILVSINYRLGPYGFMCLDIPEVVGNQGLRDQHKAFEWVRDNIVAFGGDPNSITIFGQSAGGASIDLHLYSPYVKHFQKAIVQSGSAKVEGMFTNPDNAAAVKIAKYLGFNGTSSLEAIRFLSGVDSHSVIEAYSNLGYWFRPCKEKKFDGLINFVEQDSQNLYNPKRLKNIPIFVGSTSDEEYTNDVSVFEGNPFFDKIKTHYSLYDKDIIHISNIIRQFYIGDENISELVLQELNEFDTDFHFQHPINRAVNKYIKQKAKVYQYIFAYSNDGSPVTHSAELKYLFPSRISPFNESDAEEMMISKIMTTLWTNFAKYGNPIPKPTDVLPVTLELATLDKRSYLHIDKELAIKHRPFNRRMAFWDLFYDQYGHCNVLNTKTSQEDL